MGITIEEVLEGLIAFQEKVINYFLTCRNATDNERAEIEMSVKNLKFK